MVEKPLQITLSEWQWASGWSIVLLALSNLPYLIATLATPQGWQFTGLLVNPLDGHSYLAKIRQGLEGSWLFHLTYTPEPHQGAFVYTFYLALGHLAAFIHLSPLFIFHLARLIGGLSLLLAAFRLIGCITPDPTERRLAFILLLSASGLGWLGVILGAFPIDLWIPEAFVPYSIYTNPHFPLALTFMVLIFQLVVWPDNVRARQVGIIFSKQSEALSDLPGPYHSRINLWSYLGAGLAALGLAMTLPFALLTVWAILAVYAGWLYLLTRRLPWPQIWRSTSVGLFSAPLMVYYYWVSTHNPAFASWGAQNITPAPQPLDLLLGYGLVGLLAIGGGWLIVRQGKDKVTRGEWLLIIWAVTTVALLYFPFELQRRLISGLHIPLCILAAIGLRRWLANSSLKLRYRRYLTTTVITLGILGTVFVWSLPAGVALQSPATSNSAALLFMRQEEVAAFNWLKENGPVNPVILASPRVSMFIPSQTGARVFYGHPFETSAAKIKEAQVEAFYRGDLETLSPPVDFIIYGPSERALGRPERLSSLPVVFAENGLMIYKTQK